ncbi:hypothetical protein MNEG_4374, partial [Monoraphidium neglectum]
MAGAQQPWNPFDAAIDRINFPDIELALSPGCGDVPAFDIDARAQNAATGADESRPPALGNLPGGVPLQLEAECQAWFDGQRSAKASR